jgi:Flp pilus assembly protein TadG
VSDRRIRGQTLAEFALVLPLFLAVVFGLIDMSRGVFASNTLSNAARTAARVAIVDQTVATIQAAAVDQARWLGLTAANVQVAFRLPSDPSNPANVCAPTSVGCVSVVTITYRFEPTIPIIRDLVGPLDMSATSQMVIERKSP